MTSPYILAMDLESIEQTLDLLTPEETRAVLSFIEGCEQNGTIGHADADEWRRRIRARQLCLGLAPPPRS